MKTEQRRPHESPQVRRNLAIGALFLPAILSAPVSSLGEDDRPIVLQVASTVLTEPVWLDDATVAYTHGGCIRVSPTECWPGSVSPAKHDLRERKQVRWRERGDREHGYLSRDKRLLLSIKRTGTLVVGEGVRDVRSQIKLTDRASKDTKAEFTCPDEVQGASLSPDGSVIIFAKGGDLWRLKVGESPVQTIIESKEKERFPRHSPDDQKVYFIRDTSAGADLFAFDVASQAVVQVSRGLNPVSAFSFSPDGRYIAFASANELQTRSEHAGNISVLDLETGKAKRLTEGGNDQHPSFSPNGKQIAFQRQGGHCPYCGAEAFNIVIMRLDLAADAASVPGGAKMKPEMVLPAFKPTLSGHRNNAFLQTDEVGPAGKQMVVAWRKEGPDYTLVAALGGSFWGDGLQIGANGEKICFGETHVAIDGGPEYDGLAGLLFSPDGWRVAYRARREDRWLVIVDGVEGQEYDGISDGAPVFSPDGNHVAFLAEREGRWLAVVDGVERKEYDGYVLGSKLVFDDSQSLHTLAVCSNEFLRVEITIKAR